MLGVAFLYDVWYNEDMSEQFFDPGQFQTETIGDNGGGESLEGTSGADIGRLPNNETTQQLVELSMGLVIGAKRSLPREVWEVAGNIAARTHRNPENITIEIASLGESLDQAQEKGDPEVAKLAETGILAYAVALAMRMSPPPMRFSQRLQEKAWEDDIREGEDVLDPYPVEKIVALSREVVARKRIEDRHTKLLGNVAGFYNLPDGLRVLYMESMVNGQRVPAPAEDLYYFAPSER